MSKLGFIGLGIMGTPMALRLKAGGHDLFIHTRRERHAGPRPFGDRARARADGESPGRERPVLTPRTGAEQSHAVCA